MLFVNWCVDTVCVKHYKHILSSQMMFTRVHILSPETQREEPTSALSIRMEKNKISDGCQSTYDPVCETLKFQCHDNKLWPRALAAILVSDILLLHLLSFCKYDVYLIYETTTLTLSRSTCRKYFVNVFFSLSTGPCGVVGCKNVESRCVSNSSGSTRSMREKQTNNKTTTTTATTTKHIHNQQNKHTNKQNDSNDIMCVPVSVHKNPFLLSQQNGSP